MEFYSVFFIADSKDEKCFTWYLVGRPALSDIRRARWLHQAYKSIFNYVPLVYQILNPDNIGHGGLMSSFVLNLT